MSTVPISTVDPVVPRENYVGFTSASTKSPSMRGETTSALPTGVEGSVRTPVMLFFASAIGWLLLASALGLLDALKLSFPHLLTNLAWLTWGRIHPAAIDAFIYGWAASAGIAATLWFMARMNRVPVRDGCTLVAAWLLWNLGVVAGVAGILYGNGTSVAGLEFPRYASPLIFTAFVFVMLWVLLAFRRREVNDVYIAQWYLLAAALFFPWMYATANLLLFFIPIEAPAQMVVAAWFAHGLVTLWLVPLALGIAYYVVPKVVGRPIAHYGLAKIGFWTWLLFSGLGGAYDLIGGPVPAWLLSLAVVASTLTLVPLYAIAANFNGTLAGRNRALRHSPSLRFVMVGVWCLLAAGIGAALTGFRGVNSVVHFTLFDGGLQQLFLYGFVSMALFGAAYYILARTLNAEWESPAIVRGHFWFSAVGLGLAVVALILGGAIQGLGLEDPKVPLISLLSFVKPFLFMQTVAVLTVGVGHILFAASCALMLVRVSEPSTRRPLAAVIGKQPAAAVSAS